MEVRAFLLVPIVLTHGIVAAQLVDRRRRQQQTADVVFGSEWL
jgi:hypothetical protein